jgi:hypothetical protein
MRLMNSAAEFEQIMTEFLDWRLAADEAWRRGKRAPEPQPEPAQGEMVEVA